MKLVIQDRTKQRPGISFSGRVLVFEQRARPFPHLLYRGNYATVAEAKAAAKAMRRQG
jgi:hypothetical protein